MSTSAAALRAAVPRPDRSPRHPARARRAATLRVVDVDAQRRARRVRRVLAGFCAVVVVALVGAVGFHVVVAQSQLQIDGLEAEVAAEQDRYQDLRALVAGLSSPEHITNRAQELGLVPSAEPSTVVAVPGGSDNPGDPGDPTPSDSTGKTLAESWETVKPYLDDSR